MAKRTEKREWEREEREFRLKEQERECRLKEQEIELQKLQLQSQNKSSSESTQYFDVTKHIRMVPSFQEREVDKYFLHFEKVATNCHWPKESWTMLLQSVLVGKAREIFSQLSVEDSANFDTVKELILKGYELVPEAYRQKFRNLTKPSSKTFIEFAQEKAQLFDRWCTSENINNKYDSLRELILLEEFKNCVNHDVRTFLNDKKPETLSDAARLSDNFMLTHKTATAGTKPNVSFPISPRGSNNNSFDSKRLPPPRQFYGRYPNNNFNPSNKRYEPPEFNQRQLPNKPVVCDYCKRRGHTKSECYSLKLNKSLPKPTGFISSENKPIYTQNERHNHLIKGRQTREAFVNRKRNQDVNVLDAQKECEVKRPDDLTMKAFKPFMFDGSVALLNNETSSVYKPVKILRDTGASQSLILTQPLPFNKSSYSGENVLIRGVNCEKFRSIPLHNLRLQSDLVSGEVSVGIIESLPFEGIHLLLGNDLAGDKVKVDPILADQPCLSQQSDPIENHFPDLFPSCAVTRAMKKQEIANNRHTDQEQIDISDTFLAEAFDNLAGTSQCTNNDKQNSESNFSKSNLIKEQQNDPEISVLYQKAPDELDTAEDPVCYFIKDGVLMRKWRPSDVSADEEWSSRYQIIVPKPYRSEILSLAHDTPLSGHLGINKTFQKILTHFYWPGIRKDVVEFCKTCHTCQIVGKPNQVIPKAPLKPIPAFEEPFSRVMIDCVGPLPKTKSGNQYLLTIMCVSTRFPEAIPLKNIKAKTIVQALTKFFTLVGLPKSLQLDQGSNFMSGLFQQVMYELGIKQFRSSAYHPESQGALERFHQTLKNMIRMYCQETEKNWDEGIHLLLFAARDSVQESLGFSPFELVFGHTVRGPLKLLKEKLLEDDDCALNLLEYVSDFRGKLTEACDLARKNLKSAQNCMKSKFDKHTVRRNFQVGDKVLAFLPVPGTPLQARYFGPYVVKRKVSDLNYVIATPDRRKHEQLCHVNMLKPYHERTKVEQCCSVASSDNETAEELDNLFELSASTKLSNSDILRQFDAKLTHLQPSQQEDIRELIREYGHLFPDVPSRTTLIEHDVNVGDAQPVKQHPYRLNPSKQAYLNNEIQYLLDNDLIEPSQSNWSSPCILVPKPDGSYRMCTDYRKVNNLTKTDTFPIPRMDDCVDKVGNAKYVSKFDLLKGFWQIPLSERAKEISAFATPHGLYQYKVMPFGMKNSPATFQRLINRLIADIDGCEAYIDDVIIYSDTWETHLTIMRKLFRRLSEANLTINLVKSEFGCGYVTYLGHVVGQGKVKPVDAKIRAISAFPQPSTKKQVMRSLGMAGYYRKFCPNFSSVTEPLTELLRNNVKFVWTDRCQSAFERLKALLQSAPVLSAPDFNHPFKLAVDASDMAAGAVLLQEDKNGIDHPVSYFSRKFNNHQRNYSTIEKECLALILALQHFDVYVSSINTPLEVFSDHNPLVFIHKLKNKNQRLLRWSLILSEYNMTIQHIKENDNVIADCLSRV